MFQRSLGDSRFREEPSPSRSRSGRAEPHMGSAGSVSRSLTRTGSGGAGGTDKRTST